MFHKGLLPLKIIISEMMIDWNMKPVVCLVKKKKNQLNTASCKESSNAIKSINQTDIFVFCRERLKQAADHYEEPMRNR